jgi:hypothetical protein
MTDGAPSLTSSLRQGSRSLAPDELAAQVGPELSRYIDADLRTKCV